MLFLLLSVACLASTEPLQDVPADAKESLVDQAVAAVEARAGRALDPAFKHRLKHRLLRASDEERTAVAEGRVTNTLQSLSSDQLFTPVTPCRLVDTRLAGGFLHAGEVRDYHVIGSDLSAQGGNPSGCGIPVAITSAVAVNIVAVDPRGRGNLQAWAASPGAPPPLASVINYAPVGTNLANGTIVPICSSWFSPCDNDLRVQANVSGVDLVMDVAGYFSPWEPSHSLLIGGPSEAPPDYSPLVTMNADGCYYSGYGAAVFPDGVSMAKIDGNVEMTLRGTAVVYVSSGRGDCSGPQIWGIGGSENGALTRVRLPFTQVKALTPSGNVQWFFLNVRYTATFPGTSYIIRDGTTINTTVIPQTALLP